jgi:hypothetical protein
MTKFVGVPWSPNSFCAVDQSVLSDGNVIFFSVMNFRAASSSPETSRETISNP